MTMHRRLTAFALAAAAGLGACGSSTPTKASSGVVTTAATGTASTASVGATTAAGAGPTAAPSATTASSAVVTTAAATSASGALGDPCLLVSAGLVAAIVSDAQPGKSTVTASTATCRWVSSTNATLSLAVVVQRVPANLLARVKAAAVGDSARTPVAGLDSSALDASDLDTHLVFFKGDLQVQVIALGGGDKHDEVIALGKALDTKL